MNRTSKCVLVIAVCAAPVAATQAFATPLEIYCATADSLAGGGGPMTAACEGDASGAIALASHAINLPLPAKKVVRTSELDGKPHSVTGTNGNVTVAMAMPDRAALEIFAVENTPAGPQR